MEQPPTLLEIQQTLAEQDEALLGAYRALAERGPGAISLPAALVERLEEVCQPAPVRRAGVKPVAGIRC